MQFLRTAFWVLLAIIIAIFSFANWTAVTINLWGGLQLETKLPVLVIVAFLAGSLPFWLLHKATKYRFRRRLDSAERALAASSPVATTSISEHDDGLGSTPSARVTTPDVDASASVRTIHVRADEPSTGPAIYKADRTETS